MLYSKYPPEFITVTCLDWKPLLADDQIKTIITDSLHFLTQAQRITVYGFVVMQSHFHLIWQMNGEHEREDVQRDFLKFTAQQILKSLRNKESPILRQLLVGSKDRKYQVWQRNSLGIALWSHGVFMQKLEYIHCNPVKAGLCRKIEDYKFSSARFYELQEKDWSFLEHYDG